MESVKQYDEGKISKAVETILSSNENMGSMEDFEFLKSFLNNSTLLKLISAHEKLTDSKRVGVEERQLDESSVDIVNEVRFRLEQEIEINELQHEDDPINELYNVLNKPSIVSLLNAYDAIKLENFDPVLPESFNTNTESIISESTISNLPDLSTRNSSELDVHIEDEIKVLNINRGISSCKDLGFTVIQQYDEKLRRSVLLVARVLK